jgi:L-alanine-DL-glutamate epimerase-like enolase superfamily enzyme
MKITTLHSTIEAVPLTRPYTVAYISHSDVDLIYVRLETDTGQVGLGCASPAPSVTGETIEACASALEGVDWLVGEDPRQRGRLCRAAQERLRSTPAACAAIDMALWDLFGHAVGLSVVDLIGRCHDRLPTSITIGIKSTEEALDECREYLGRGFRHLKVKIGSDLEQDVERVAKLHEVAGAAVHIRVDANQGYNPIETEAFYRRTTALGLELIEQPLPDDADDELARLSAPLRAVIAADESLHTEADALRLASPPPTCGIFNIKLMKCGGISGALEIAGIAKAGGVDLMWGCMDESAISIAAALHAAYASPTTKYLDLDGSFDLARDLALGGFELEDGVLRTTPGPGLGVRMR